MTQDQIKVMRFQSGLTRDDLRDAVYRAVPELTRDKAKKILDEVFEEIIDSLARNEPVSFRGFGKFKIQHKRERMGRNPKTQVDAKISARRVTKFVPCKALIASVNGGST
jgi:integration host factor subunit alpha